MRAQIQALNQRIDDLDKKLNKRMDDLITYLWIFMGFITILTGFIIGFGLLLVEQAKKKLNLKLK
jgi:tetrahydromethanopterin S-methyltransferase subunit G